MLKPSEKHAFTDSEAEIEHLRKELAIIHKKALVIDDIKNQKNYNKLIKIKKNIQHEKLFRNDQKYDLLIPISYNRKKRVLGKGSAIFIHLTKNYNKTDGCIALKKNDFLILLKLINKKTQIKIS